MGLVVPINTGHAIVGEDFWFDISTGDWTEDCRVGRERANNMMICLADNPERHANFGRSMRDIVQRGRFTGVETGFFQRLLELAITGHDTDANK